MRKIAILMRLGKGIALKGIEKHNWTDVFGVRNMSRDGFRQRYDQILGEKPNFDDCVG